MLQVGTSTGAIVAVSMACLRMPLDDVEAVYTELGKKVRTLPAPAFASAALYTDLRERESLGSKQWRV